MLAQESFTGDAFGVNHTMRIRVGDVALESPALALGNFLERYQIPLGGSEHRDQRVPLGAAVADIESQDSDGHFVVDRSRRCLGMETY
jgi:hypothetical protein